MMTLRFRLEFIPRASWQPGTDAADQRWTRTPDVFSGTPDEATREVGELEGEYGREIIFRAVPLESQPEDEPGRYCGGCGGDFTAAYGHQLACSCQVMARTVAAPVGKRVAS